MGREELSAGSGPGRRTAGPAFPAGPFGLRRQRLGGRDLAGVGGVHGRPSAARRTRAGDAAVRGRGPSAAPAGAALRGDASHGGAPRGQHAGARRMTCARSALQEVRTDGRVGDSRLRPAQRRPAAHLPTASLKRPTGFWSSWPRTPICSMPCTWPRRGFRRCGKPPRSHLLRHEGQARRLGGAGLAGPVTTRRSHRKRPPPTWTGSSSASASGTWANSST